MKNCKINSEELKKLQDFLFGIIKSEVERKVKDEIYDLDEDGTPYIDIEFSDKFNKQTIADCLMNDFLEKYDFSDKVMELNGKTYDDIWMQTTPYMGKVRVYFMNKEIFELDKEIENSDGYYLNFIDKNDKKKYFYLNNSRLMYGEVIDNDKLHILNSVDIFNNTVDEVMWMVDNVIDDVDDKKNNKSIEIKGNIRLMVNEIYANAKNKAIA